MSKTIQLKSKTVVADPCYRSIGNSGMVLNTKEGTWKVGVDKSNEGAWGIRVSRLFAHHESVSREIAQIKQHEEGMVGVDSGQMSIYDPSENYPFEGGYEDKTSSYGKVCALTTSEDRFGVLDSLVCSGSGFGDGRYPCFVARNAENEVVGIEIEFIADVDGDDYEDFDDDDDYEDDDYEEDYDDEDPEDSFGHDIDLEDSYEEEEFR